MIKEIRKIGNSKGVILDSTILDALNVDAGDKVNVTIHASGSVTLTPIHPIIDEKEAANLVDDLITNNDELFRRLS